MLIWAIAVWAGMRGPPDGKPSRALVLRSRCRWRSTSTRRRARQARTRTRLAVIAGAGRLAVAAPVRVVVMMGGRAAVTDIWRGWPGGPAGLPLPGGRATAGGGRAPTARGRARQARTRAGLGVIGGAGRLAGAAPGRVVVMIARRAAVNDIWRGWTGWPARLPLPAGTATAAAARATARARPVAVTQAACSWAI